jgi:DNA primase
MEFAPHALREKTVSTGSSPDVKEQVKQAIDIVDLVGSFLQLRRQGRNYVALCPWHDDQRPSLQVNAERQSWKCWVCDVGGDIFSFMMKMEGVEFREALAMLADRAGIQMTPTHHEAKAEAGGEHYDKRALYKAMTWVEQQYHACLLESAEAEPARKYLRERGISDESIARFSLGFSPVAWDWILQRAGGSPQRAKILETIGVLGRSAGGSGYYDRFRGRVLFSIHDAQGRPVGMGGRVLPEIGSTNPGKYVNSPETPLFTKSKLLYGLDVAREAIRKEKVALVMEGYTDCIVAQQYGFTNAVAVLGTALGEAHVRILKRFADRIVLVLDGDEAGQRRAGEVLELFVAQQVDLRIVTLPDDLDPCEFLQERGADAFRELIEHAAIDALEHAFRRATAGVDLEHDIHRSSEAMERLLAIIAKAPRLQYDTTRESRLREQKMLQRMAALFRVDETELRSRLTGLRRAGVKKVLPAQSAAVPVEDATADDTPPSAWERELLELLLLRPEQWPAAQAEIDGEHFASQRARQIYTAGCRLTDDGVSAAFAELMLEFDHPAIKALLVELSDEGQAKGIHAADPAARLRGLIAARQRKEVEQQRPAHVAALRENQIDTQSECDLLAQIVQQEKKRQGIAKPTDG